MNSRTDLASFLVSFAALLSACQDGTMTGPRSEANSPGTGRVTNQAAQGSLDDYFVQISARVPSFGGAFLDSVGILKVYLVDLSQEAAARSALAPLLSTPRLSASGRLTTGQMTMVEGQYSFNQLNAWRAAAGEALNLAGVVYLDVDEVVNRVAIGVENPDAAARVEAELVRLGIPPEAVAVRISPPALRLATLRERVRPIDGGLQITSSVGICTLSFTAFPGGAGGTRSYLTASHCTAAIGIVDSSAHHQPVVSGSDNRIGQEYADPPYFTGGPCPAGRRCRWTDAAMGAYDAAVPSDSGHIARPTSRHQAPDPEEVTINSTFPHFLIRAELDFPIAGQLLEKVGRTTGWTFGTVQQTCQNFDQAADTTLLCQYTVNGGVRPGDSGSPVFSWSYGGSSFGHEVTLAGVLWGGIGETTFIFGAMREVEFDLGPLYTTTSEPAPPPPLSVEASGLNSAPEFSEVTVTATVSGGTGQVTYAWTVNGAPACGNSNTCTRNIGAAGTFTTFEVTVTDAGPPQQTASDTHNVFAEFPECPECLGPRKGR